MITLLPNIPLAVLVGLALVALPFLLLVLPRKPSHQQPTDLPPGNMGWPFFGETIGFLRPHKSNSTGTFLQQHTTRHGKIFKSHLFGCPTIVSCDLELNVFILQNEEKLFKSSYPRAIYGILGHLSLLTATGATHKKLRSIAVGFIGASKLKPQFLLYLENLSLSMIESWKERKQILLCNEAKKFTFYITVKNVLSIDGNDSVALKILEAFLTYMKGFVSLPLPIPGMPFSKAVQARARISSTLKEIIREREKLKNPRLDDEDGDFLDVIMSKGLNDEEKVSVVLDVLLGSHETTAILLALILYFLERSPLALEYLKEEHRAIRKGKEAGEPLNGEDYKQMKFTQHVIYESMRCGNVVKFVHRKAIQDVKFKGYLIPSGWKVLPVFTATHLDPSLHDNPTEFNPWRWEDPEVSKRVTPFGGGLRLCPGAELGKLELAFFLHHFVLNCRWKSREDDSPLAYPYVAFPKGLPLEIEAATC